jgi:hypothetical protein
VTKVSDLRLLIVLAASRRTPHTDGCIRAVLPARKGVPIKGPRRLLLPLFPFSPQNQACFLGVSFSFENIPAQTCEGYSGLAPRRYCKEDIIRVQRLLESMGLLYDAFIIMVHLVVMISKFSGSANMPRNMSW